MSHRFTFLAIVLFSLSALAGGATLPASPTAPLTPAAVVPPAPAASPAWLQPAPNSSVEKPGVNANRPGEAPLGAIFKDACSQGCLQDETACFNCCGGDHSCNVSCSNNYYCCLQTCNPSGPQCP
jgi:hypothetical protein